MVSFALHDGTNRYVFGGDTGSEQIQLGRFDGKKRVAFHLKAMPLVQGRYWVTLGVHGRDVSRVYHVQDQRYSFEVQQSGERRDQVFIAMDTDVEDL